MLVPLCQVGLALVPQEAGQGVGHQGLDHARTEVAAGEPLGDRRSAHRGGNEPHGHAEFRLELLGEEVARRRDGGEGLAVRDLPGVPGRLAPARGAAAAQVHADGRVGRGGELGRGQVLSPAGRGLPGAPHLIGHVGLSGAEPDLAEDHVREAQGFLLPAHLQDIGAAVGLSGGQFREPGALSVGPDLDARDGGAARFREQGDDDLLFRGGFAPDGHAAALLQDHVVGEDLRQEHRQDLEEKGKGHGCHRFYLLQR